MAEKIKLFEADIDVDGVIKKSSELKQELESLREQQKKLKDNGDVTSESYVKLEAQIRNVSTQYRLNQQLVQNLTNSMGEMMTVEQKMTSAIESEIRTIDNAVANNKELRKIRNSINAETEEGRLAIEQLNKKIDENTKFIKSNTDAYSVQKMNIGDYKNQIKEAYTEMEKERKALEANNKELARMQKETKKGSDEWKFFNQQIQQNNVQINQLIVNMGGLNEEVESTSLASKALSGDFKGLAQDAQKVGGAGNMVKLTLKGVTAGIWNVIKASVAFIATPIGAILTVIALALGALVSYLTRTEEGMDKVTAVTRPLIEVFKTLLSTAESLGGALAKAFSGDIRGAIKDVKETVSGLGNELEEAWERGKRLDQVLSDIGSTELMIAASESAFKDALLEQNKIYRDRSKSADERMKAAEEILNIEKAQSLQQQNLLRLEVERLAIALETSGLDEDRLAYQQALNKLKDEERRADELQVAMLSRINNIRNQAERERKEAEQEKEQAERERIQREEKAFDESIKRQKLELDLYLANQGIRKKTLAEEVAEAERTSEKLIEIKRQELEAKRISEKEFELYVKQQENELARYRAELAIANYQKEFEEFKKEHEKRVDAGKFFSQELYEAEVERLDLLLEQEQRFWDKKLELGLINQEEYNAKLNELNEEHQNALEEARIEREQAEQEKRFIDLENERELKREQLDYDLEFQLEELERLRQQELEAAERTGADIALINDKYAKLREETEQRVIENKMSLMSKGLGDFTTVLGQESALGKAAAVMQATIDTYQSAISAYKAMVGIPVVGPALAVTASAAAIKTGLQNVKKITSAKTPKAEKGATFTIGGKRHANGGTKFYGEDGTHFEAEKGEQMFILNRQASSALAPLLSGINESYGGVSLSRASTYLASGGQVMRQAIKQQEIDIDELKEAMTESAREGTREGSSQGTYFGIATREINTEIASGANF